MKESAEMLKQVDKRVTAEPIFKLIPGLFTIQQFREERIRQSQSADVKTLLSRYCKKGKIQRLDKGVYRNLVKVTGVQVSDAENR